ncbi:hypothetical protein MSAN_00404800 [Mycena sanguinolenta]|uniref:Glucose receptor Git3 N-terminal domain-containing protein n=1 Tax=Mycena sanguinolenta TaxID=230812 RepID=A0A8H6ZCL5_9AGAR|nr:hypothetical protein MSAN_00404800 [Mycena sanguinolenta]
MSSLEFLRFTSQEIPGAIVVNAFAILSALALLSVASRVIFLAVRRFLSGSSERDSREYVFFNTVLGNYAACLLISNIISSVAGMMGLDQLLHGGIQEGTYCTTQAIVMQVGNFAGAYFTIAIAIHTVNSLVLKRRQSTWVCIITICVGWIASGVNAAAPLFTKDTSAGPLYGISGLSCGIREVYPRTLFFFHLFPIFITSIMSALLYSLIFLVLRGSYCPKHAVVSYCLHLVSSSILSDSVDGTLWSSGSFPASRDRLCVLGVANVLALYNTFRVLGPAFNAKTTSQKDLESNVSGTRRVMPPMIAVGEQDQYPYRPSESMSEKSSRPNSLSSFNQVQPASSENPGAPFRLMAPPLAARIQERREQYSNDLSRVHSRTDSEHSNWTATPSFYSYDNTTEAPRPMKGRVAELLLNEPVVNGAPSRVRPASSRSITPVSDPPTQSLPAPPRMNRQVIAKRPVSVAPSSPHESIEIRYSNGSSEMDITGWLDEQRPDGYMPHGLVSAVGSTYSVPPVPSPAVPPLPTRNGSLDITRSRSQASPGDRGRSRKPEQSRPRGNSTPDR